MSNEITNKNGVYKTSLIFYIIRPENSAFISICCLPEIKKGYLEAVKKETDEHWFKENHENVLNVEFDDILMEKAETEYGTVYGMTDEEAS